MKTLKLIGIAVCAIFLLQSCEKEGKIRIQNKISKVTITDVKWGKHYITYRLLPGETSGEVVIGDYDKEKLPSQYKVSFRMTANNKSIYLETEDMYRLDEDDNILIVLTDETKVKNPNQSE